MNKLKTTYLGLDLRSPLIVSSSRLTSSLDHLKEAEECGAGAVVLKSLFEEQIMHSINAVQVPAGYPEADDYIAYYTKSYSVDEYIELIGAAKKELSIPVIPSINCFSSEGWTEFAEKISDSGADALEVNVFFMPTDRKRSSAESEEVYFNLIEKLNKTVRIPMAFKIGPRFSNLLFMLDQFYMRGLKGVVMFNRFYEPDIDVNKMEIVAAPIFSTAEERRYVLRWIAMASAQDFKLDISASTGVRKGEDAVRYILAGASAVQVCSVLYQKGIPYLKTLNEEVSGWMDKMNFKSIGEFRGKLNWENYERPEVFERTQFMKYFSSLD
ncbi:MAG TPA: dihydroorotate dehydrogenase-like protein [Bacteroidales bacterium]|nr:dihydroorotate dehydrogenase-like protein [Bacteroidales bacterium]